MRKTKRNAFLSLTLAVLLVVSAMPLGMLSAFATTDVGADPTWYNMTAETLYIDDAGDLWAFASQLDGGTNFAGQTIKMRADVIVNTTWDAFAETVTPPTYTWPLDTNDQEFAGTFDGQGHTISGIYMTAAGEGVGIFGNVATGTTAVVKNVKIVNSYVEGGTGSADSYNSAVGGVGGIFGEVNNETTSAPITDETHVNATKAIVDNVYAEINVVSTGTGASSNLGTGGIIGGVRADAEITNTTFAGRVDGGGVRGTAAFVGAIRPYQTTYDDEKETNYYLNTVTIKNCLANATITSTQIFSAAFIGYTNANTTTHNLENVISTCSTISGSSRIGNAFGGSYTGANAKRDAEVTDTQTWNLDNVHYLAVSGTNGMFGNTPATYVQNGVAQPHSTMDGMYEVIADVLEDSLQQSVTLRNNLTLNAYAMILDPDATVTIDGVAIEGVPIQGSAHRFSLDGILPQQMADTYELKITQTLAGKTFEITKDIGVRRYCDAFWAQDFATDVEKDLIADMLRYGEQAQSYSDYNTANPATAGMALTGYGSSVDASSISGKYNLTGSTAAGYAFLGAALRLDNSLAVRLKFQAPSTADLTLSVSINGRTTTFNANSFAPAGNQTYLVTFENIGAHEMEAAITATLMQGGTAVQTLTYSVADYCKALLTADASGDETLAKDQAIVEKMYAYGLSAAAYNDANRKVIIDGTETDYVIVHDDANETAKTLAYAFAADLYRKTGVMLSVVDDTVANAAKEIVIGYADGREETETVYNQLTSYEKKGSRIAIVENDIVVVSGSDALLEHAVEELLNEIRTHGGDTWSVGLDYSAQIDLPAYTTSGTQKVYYANENNHTLSVVGTSLTEYEAYVATLKANGFVEYTTNNINDNLFGTYVKTDGGSNMVAYTAYYPGGTGTDQSYETKTNGTTVAANCRITYGPLTFLPGTEEITASATGVRAIPSIMQPKRLNAYMSASGMCYVIQLLDGSFILLDGGNSDGKVQKSYNITSARFAEFVPDADENTAYDATWEALYGIKTTTKVDTDDIDKDGDKTEALYTRTESAYYVQDDDGNWVQQPTPTSNDAEAIYNLLVEMSPDEKPVIAAWFISHAHGDHINMSYSFMDKFYDKVDVKMVAHNFPAFDTYTMADGAHTSMWNLITKFNTKVATYYPNAERWIVHAGQKLYLPGCSIEIFFTPEEMYGYYDETTFSNSTKGQHLLENGNETSLMFRITVGDTGFMVTGDSEIENCTQAGVRFEDALESDILQTPHHGLNGPELGFYEYVDPKIVLWSIDEHRVATDSRCLGYRGSSSDGGYSHQSNGSAYTPGYGPDASGTSSSYYANGWLQTSSWERSDGTSGTRAIYGVNATAHTQIFCSYPDDFVIQTSPMPLG